MVFQQENFLITEQPLIYKGDEMKSYLVLSSILLFTFATASFYDYRPYISTNMAKIIIESNTPAPTPDEDDEVEGCDGSGWITHGDGHRTPCPGCDKCKKKSMTTDVQYYVYHLGAEWCGPCIKLKRDVWANEELREMMGEVGAKLYIFDADNPDHKKMFDYYKAKLYPTIIVVDKNSGEVLNRFEGFRTLEEMKKTIKDLGNINE